jgi:hypothetical protein
MDDETWYESPYDIPSYVTFPACRSEPLDFYFFYLRYNNRSSASSCFIFPSFIHLLSQ